MSNYDKFWSKVSEQRRKAAAGHKGNASLYSNSDLIKRLATETGYRPQSPKVFLATRLDRSAQSGLAQTERVRSGERDKQLRERYAAIEAEQMLILETADPYRISLEGIIVAQRNLEASRWFLGRIPEDVNQEDNGMSNEDFRAHEIERLKAWRSRLRVEHLRITNDINTLEPQSINFESPSARYGLVARLLDDLDCITRAIDDASENLKIANNGQPVHDYPMGTSG
jgi:hypothetical protein